MMPPVLLLCFFACELHYQQNKTDIQLKEIYLSPLIV